MSGADFSRKRRDSVTEKGKKTTIHAHAELVVYGGRQVSYFKVVLSAKLSCICSWDM